MSDFTRLSGIEPLYKYDLDPKIDKAKAREAAHSEMARLRKEKEHQSVLDDRTKIMSGLKQPDQAGIINVDDEPEPAEENLDMAGPVDPKDMAFANLEARKMTKAQSVAAKRAFVKQAHAKRHQRGHSFDREEYPPIKGMEGPFSMKLKGGQRGVVYYDPKEGKYYDRKTDMYVQAESIQESAAPGDIWVQNFKTQKSIYFLPLRKGKNGNFQGLVYDPNFSRKAKWTSVPKINGPKSSRSLWNVETRVPMVVKGAFMDHPKYQQATEALEGKEVSGILAYTPGNYVLSRENGKYHLEKGTAGRRTHKAIDASSAYKLYQKAKKKEVAPEDAFPSYVLENVQRIAKFNEGSPGRYEIVVNGKLYDTAKKPSVAIVIGKRKKGSVQIVDSKTGDILYDSEMQGKTDKGKSGKRAKKISAMQRIRLNRSATDAKMKKAKK
jgi:hypothetical protein